ncbi:ABC transporter permease [Microcella daejeonensis]|uniref:ABC transporter permease n=1 Tax=Microcella daejeonensis TaxID=2994971 RepID=UPI0038990DA7
MSSSTVVTPAVEPRSAAAPRGSTRPVPSRRARGGTAAWGVAPFAVYVALFLVLPTVIALATGFVDEDGAPTLDTVAALGDPFVLRGFGTSIALSAVTAVIGALLGALVSYAIVSARPEGMLRSVIDAASGVLAQFGGVMLAFAFIATIGIQGGVTVLLRDLAGIDIFADGVWLYESPGLILPYIYFQVPLMIIVFLPALESLKPQWAEANATLGGTTATFWWRIGIPVLWPSFLGSLLLLFANAFSSYATAAALTSQGQSIVPLQIRAALTSETLLGRENLAGALALGMVVVMVIVMTLYALLQRRADRWRR